MAEGCSVKILLAARIFFEGTYRNSKGLGARCACGENTKRESETGS